MKKYVNGKYIKMTKAEIEEMRKHIPESMMYSYDELVNMEIRKRYSQSQEFAILRQKNEKPDEFAEYYAYCEECKKKFK